MMTKYSTIIVFLCTLLMVGGFFYPFWQIVLEAPQYPEGLSMQIWVSGLSGNVEQINGLNHYIGMKHIHAEDFPEFRIIPFVLGAIIITGLITTLKRSVKWLKGLCIFLLSFGIVGAIDLYRWEYDYGHNLDPTAAIKVPGMTYQPPLLGYKQLLNFLAGSFPDTGGYLVIIPALIIIGVLVFEIRRKKQQYELA
ncbi:hypothetical protein [Chitinophaga defluvii]|uniref:Copper chaperone NosL n=1 Tax=Chitinophaga defluvii TaxID=3163343 RepID=A0ABV2T1M5_9BACT